MLKSWHLLLTAPIRESAQENAENMIYVIAYQLGFWYDSSIELPIRLSPEGVDPRLGDALWWADEWWPGSLG